jgi:FMN phosphatase YigB (HAD superfamily)
MRNDSPAFIFDLGKVLVDFNYEIAAQKIGDRSTKSPNDLHAFLGASPLLADYECGRLTREMFFQAIRSQIDFQGDVREFGGYFADIFSEIPDMIRLQAELRQNGYKTYIFSNTNDLAVEHISRNFPFFQNFDGYIYSYQVGAMKPQPKIYEAMEAMAGKRGADLIYIDDRAENIAAGAARGWHAILHETPEQTRTAITSRL